MIFVEDVNVITAMYAELCVHHHHLPLPASHPPTRTSSYFRSLVLETSWLGVAKTT